MKQAILITGYKNIEGFLEIINFFDDNFNFYVHIDKKSKIDISPLLKIKNVFVYKQYAIHWGGINHLLAILLLSKEALLNKENTFFHLITAEDYPAKPIGYFHQLDTSVSYIEFFELPRQELPQNGWMDRIDYYNFYDLFDAKTGRQYKVLDNLLKIQQALRIKRRYSKDFPKLFGGSTYWSINRSALAHVINYTKQNDKFLSRFKYTFCAEEMYFQTILLNSEFKNFVVNDNLRYIDWNSGRGGYPAFLDASDFTGIVSSNKLFARKLQTEDICDLKLLLKAHLSEK